MRLAAALGWYWSLRSMKIEGAELVADALSAVGTPPPPPAALPDAERMGLPEMTAFAAYTAADLARLEGEPEAARAALIRALDLARGPDVAQQQLHAVTATALGYLAGAAGELDAASAWHAEALAAARSTADAPVIAGALAGLADLALREGDPERSAGLLGASLGIRGALDRSAVEEQAVAEQARALLGDARYDAAYQRGQGATLDTLATLVPGGSGGSPPRASTVTPGA